MSGNHGGDLFEFPDRTSEELIKKQALLDVLSSDILEWYRIQYNFSIHDPRFLEVSEEEAMKDFYRRQYYHEIQYGLRDFSSRDIKFNMPSFVLLKQFGGALPAPNGFKYTDDNTISRERLKNTNTGNKNSNEDEWNEDENLPSVSPESINPDIPPHLTRSIEKPYGGMVKNETSEFGLDDEDFWKWVEEEENKKEES